MRRAVFVLDLDRCTGCSACAVACRNENGVDPAGNWRRVTTFNAPRLPDVGVVHYSLACNHCAGAPCLKCCPAAAFSRSDDGVVTLDDDRCMGCRYCTWVCPYEAPRFNPATGTVEKCTLCPDRRAAGRDPACVAACPVAALGFEIDGEAEVGTWPGFPDVGADPGLRLVHSSTEVAPPAMMLHHEHHEPPPAAPKTQTRDALAAEWPLWAFTSIVTWLVVWFVSAASRGAGILAIPFAAATAVAIGCGLAHLGRPGRCFSAAANFTSSWISREVVLFAMFVVTAVAASMTGKPLLLQAATVFGACTLYSIDMVYCIRGQSVPMFGHSAMTTLSAAFLISAINHWALPLLVVALFRAALFAARRRRGWLSTYRIASLMVLPALLWVVHSSAGGAMVVLLLAAGELLDRAWLYAELDFLTPRLQAQRDLRRVRSPGI